MNSTSSCQRRFPLPSSTDPRRTFSWLPSAVSPVSRPSLPSCEPAWRPFQPLSSTSMTGTNRWSLAPSRIARPFWACVKETTTSSIRFPFLSCLIFVVASPRLLQHHDGLLSLLQPGYSQVWPQLQSLHARNHFRHALALPQVPRFRHVR